MSLGLGLKFASERFDYRSSLPEAYNAGNRFYGRDVAEFLTRALGPRGFEADFLDEDWGWLVSGRTPDGLRFEVAIYNLADHGEGGRPGIGAWGLWVRAYRSGKFLGFLPRTTEAAVPSTLDEALRAALLDAGAPPEYWDDGPGGE